MDCYSAFTLILFFLFSFAYIFFCNHGLSASLSSFFHLYIFFSLIYFFYNHDLRASSSAPPLLLGPNLFFDNRGVQASVDTPWLISEPIYYYFLFFSLYVFLFTNLRTNNNDNFSDYFFIKIFWFFLKIFLKF